MIHAGSETKLKREKLQREIHDKAMRVSDSWGHSVMSIIEAAEAVATGANNYVKRRPWTSIVIAAGVVLLAGMQLGRRR